MPNPEQVLVAQEDRDAAADLYLDYNGSDGPHAKTNAAKIRSGVWSGHSFVQAFARHRVAASRTVEGGWKLVPIEPTEAMQQAALSLLSSILVSPAKIWSTMLSASPAPVIDGME